MKAIILAAGQGTRLRPITDNIPKTLVSVMGKPIIYHQISALYDNGIKDVVICTGYLSEKIVDYCRKNFSDINFSFVHSDVFKTTNNMYSLYLAREHLNGDFFLMNGDVVFDGEIIGAMIKEKGNVIAVDRGRYIGESMKLVVDSKVFIKDISKKIDKNNTYGSSIDVYKISSPSVHIFISKLKEYIEVKKDLNQWTEVLLQSLMKDGDMKFRPYDINGALWWEIDDMDDVDFAERIFKNKLLLDNKKVFFIDGDGTLFVGNKKINGADLFLKKLVSEKKLFYIFSNNTSKTHLEHQKNLLKKGIKVKKDQILLPTDAMFPFLKKQGFKKIFLVGTKSVAKEFKKAGFKITDRNPDVVVLTYDTSINYEKIKTATILINRGVRYFASHIDILCPSEDGFLPDIGTFTEMLKTATGKLPEKTFGKPSFDILEEILGANNIKMQDVVVIGDRLYTDIQMAKNAGCDSILVLSGETKDEDVKRGTIKPDFVFADVGRILDN